MRGEGFLYGFSHTFHFSRGIICTMKLLVGLGNPGEKYERTRHNLGAMLIAHFFQDFEPVEKTIWDDAKKFKSDIAEIVWQKQRMRNSAASGEPMEKVILAKPKTYMNNSGMAVKLIADYYRIAPEDIWVMHDELDLPIGMLKIRFGGGTAGHHGVESILEKLGTDKFWRFRLGIGEQQQESHYVVKDAEDFVLGSFTGSESRKIKELVKRGVKAIELGLEKDLHHAMNRYNTK